MIILAVETATEACSAAVYRDGAVIERYRLAPREHNRLILPMVEGVLAEAGLALSDIDALAFGRGPGSFTGVRIAAGVAQGIAFGAGLPVIPVSTLAALAWEALDQEPSDDWAIPCLDARMSEVYCAVYRRDRAGGPTPAEVEQVIPPSRIPPSVFPSGRGVGIGSGWATYGEAIRAAADRPIDVLPNRFPRAGYVARLGARGFGEGKAVPATQALPVYLRDRVIHNRPPA